MELLDKFYEELKEDVKFDQINILEKQLQLPAIKHKWVTRLIEAKKNKILLERKRRDVKDEVLKTLMSNGLPSGVPKTALSQKIESSEAVCKIDSDLEMVDLVIQYLEKVEKILSSVTFDIGNATKLMVLETT